MDRMSDNHCHPLPYDIHYDFINMKINELFIDSMTDMSNINIRNSSSCLEFLGDYAMESVELKNGDELNGKAIMRLLIDGERYEMSVNMKNGKKEGVGEILREDGTLFMRMTFVNDECEGELIKKNEYGSIVLKGRMEKGKEVGMWIEYDDYGNEIWRGFYRNGEKDLSLKEYEGMSGLWREVNERGELLSVSEYDDGLLKNGKCFEYEGGRLVRECEYKNGVMMRVLREWKGECMIEYDDNGMRVYEGGFEGDMMKGFVREGKGKEYGNDGKSALYVGGWKNGKRDGYGSEFKGRNPVYIGEWKNGMRHGAGKELNDSGEVIRSGRWNKGEHEDPIKRLDDGYGTDLSEFDTDCLKGVERLEIGKYCFKKAIQLVIDGLNELKSIIIGIDSFSYDNRKGSKCVIMNCDQLNEINIGAKSFHCYESFELKNLPSPISIQLDKDAFEWCHSIVFESMND